MLTAFQLDRGHKDYFGQNLMLHNHDGYHNHYITNALMQMYISQLFAGGSTIPWIIKTAPPHICLILKSFKLLEYQWQENVYLIKTNQKLPHPLQFMTIATSMTVVTGMGWTVQKNDLLILLIIEKVEPSWTMTLHIFQHRDLARGS